MLKVLCIFIFTVDIKGLYTQSHLFIHIPVNIIQRNHSFSFFIRYILVF